MWKSNEFHKFYISNNSKLKKKVYVSNVTEKSFPIDLAKKTSESFEKGSNLLIRYCMMCFFKITFFLL